jgi:hypothetical protein
MKATHQEVMGHFLFPRCLSYSRASAGKEGTFKLIQAKVSVNPKTLRIQEGRAFLRQKAQ